MISCLHQGTFSISSVCLCASLCCWDEYCQSIFLGCCDASFQGIRRLAHKDKHMDSSAGQSGQYLLGSFLGTILENSSSFEEVGTAFAGIVVLMIILAFIAGIIIAAFLNFVMNSAKMALHHEEKSFPRLRCLS